MLPFILITQFYFVTNRFAVCVKLHFDKFRSYSILIFCIIPYLTYAMTRLSRCMTIDNFYSISNISDIRCIVGHIIFSYPVNNFRSFLIFRKILKRTLPTIFCFYFFRSYKVFTCVQIYLDNVWSCSILIFCIIPNLAYRYSGFLRDMRVGNIISIYSCLIIVYSIFCYGILNQFAFCILRQVLKRVTPVSTFIRCYRLALARLSICKQIYCDALRSLSILIVRIVPGLCSTDVYLFWLMGIRNLGTLSGYVAVPCFIPFR